MLLVNKDLQFQIALFMFKFTTEISLGYQPVVQSITSLLYSTRSSISGFAMPSVRTKIRQKSVTIISTALCME